MNKLTAQDFLKENGLGGKLKCYNDELQERDCDDIIDVMVEFAKFHVTKALIKASLNVKITYEYEGNTGSEYCDTIVDQKSILNAYSLENII